ncbi:NAD(P)H-dependent oxidoreductase [Thalassotalea ganghwensis]
MKIDHQELLNALNWRYAVKQFSERKVTDEMLTTLLEAARLTPSSYGLQPYSLLVIESKVIREQLLSHSFQQDKVLHCSHLLVFAAKTIVDEHLIDRYIEKTAELSDRTQQQLEDYRQYLLSVFSAMKAEQKQQWSHQQAYIALGNVLTCAALLQIDCCPMTGIDSSGYDQVLNLADKGLTTTAICPIGYRALHDKSAQATKIRVDREELIIEV